MNSCIAVFQCVVLSVYVNQDLGSSCGPSFSYGTYQLEITGDK